MRRGISRADRRQAGDPGERRRRRRADGLGARRTRRGSSTGSRAPLEGMELTMIFRQLFEPESSTYTYLLGCQESGKDRKSVVSGKSVSVRVDLGGSRSIKKKT